MHPNLLQHLLENSANKFPERKAVVFKEQSISYADLLCKSNKLKVALLEMGVRKGDRVGFLLNKSIESIICVFGILGAGACYVPIDPVSPPSRIKFIINNCEVRVALLSYDVFDKIGEDFDLGSVLKKVVLINGDIAQVSAVCPRLDFFSWDEVMLADMRIVPGLEFSEDSPAYILHTSGSTGAPKGVVLTHHNSLAFVNMAADFFKISSDDRLGCLAPLHFDLSIFDIFVAIKRGATIILVPEIFSLFPVKLAQFIDDSEITIWNSVASVLSLLAERGRMEQFSYDFLRLILFSGDILPVKYLKKIMTAIPTAQYFNIYGQTEANSSIFYPVDKLPSDNTWKIPIGQPFPTFEVFALNDNGEIINAAGEVGELYICSETVAAGYWRDVERTSLNFIDVSRFSMPYKRAYKTGDLVSMDYDGNYNFLGRKDLQVKSRGYRVQLNEIEFIVKSYSKIKEAIVVAVPDEIVGNRIVALVTPQEESELTDIEVFDHISKNLPRYMVPESITFMDSFPKTSSGKIDRNLLKKSVCVSPN